MRKTLAVLVFAASLAALFTGCAKEETPAENIVFIGTVEEVYDNGLLITATAGEAGFDRASVGFTPDMGKLGFTLLPGQTVLLTVLPEISESDPVQVSAVSIEFVSGPIAYTETHVRTTCTKENAAWDFVAEQAENAEDIRKSGDYGLYLPLLLFDSREELSAFIEEGGAYIRMEEGFDGDESVSAAAERYGEEFFEENQLLVLYLYADKAPARYEISNILAAGDTLSVTAVRTIPETFMDYSDNIYCVFFVELDRDMTAFCKAFATGFSETIVEGW